MGEVLYCQGGMIGSVGINDWENAVHGLVLYVFID